MQARDENALKERLHNAKFPQLKTLAQFNFEEIPTLDRNLILPHFTGGYLAAAENLVLMGGHGTGKSHMAVALGVEA